MHDGDLQVEKYLLKSTAEKGLMGQTKPLLQILKHFYCKITVYIRHVKHIDELDQYPNVF